MAKTTVEAAKLLSPEELADYFGVPIKTVYVWNSRGDGPRRFRIGRHVRYRLSDVEAWLTAREMGGGSAA